MLVRNKNAAGVSRESAPKRTTLVLMVCRMFTIIRFRSMRVKSQSEAPESKSHLVKLKRFGMNHSTGLLPRVALSLLTISFSVNASADIYQWEYIDPLNPSLGKQQSSTLAPDGEGLDAISGADLAGRDLTRAYLIGAHLTNASLSYGTLTFADLTNADLSHSNLTGASLRLATLSDADLVGAEVRMTDFRSTTSRGFSAVQLYSTASYQAKDLTGINLLGNNLSGWSFAGQNLTSAIFVDAMLADTILTDADVRGAYFYSTTSRGFTSAQLYSTASYQAKDLTGIRLRYNDLAGWNFAAQNLTDADFRITALSGADLKGAEIRGADFASTTFRGFSAMQLYSTASYQANDLTGINLANNNLSGWNFSGQNLSGADFSQGSLTGADFTGTEIRGASFLYTTYGGFTSAQLYSTDSYQARDLMGINLGINTLFGWNFSGQNLTGASFYEASVTDADLSGAQVRGASFYNTTSRGFTAAQLYSTASYQARDLIGINLGLNDLSNWTFTGQNLTNATFNGASLSGADFGSADLRGALRDSGWSGAELTNAILPDGLINGLVLTIGQSLVVRDYDGNPAVNQDPIPIHIKEHAILTQDSMLRIVFEDDSWDSLISFDPGILVQLDGTLDLDFAEGTSVASQVGRTIQVFDWTGVSPAGQFDVVSPYTWDLSQLMTSGEVTLLSVGLPGDFNGDNLVDAADYNQWKQKFGSVGDFGADGNDDSVVNAADYTIWRNNFGRGSATSTLLAPDAVPEPTSMLLFVTAVGVLLCFKLTEQFGGP